MRRKILTFILIIIFIISILSGCYEKTNKEENEETIITVSKSGTGNFSTIQEGIDAADPGDTVYVYNGIYSEMLKISKSIKLIGEDKNTTFIIYQEPVIESSDIIFINADNCIIEGFTIIGNSSFELTGISINSSNNIITHVAVSNMSKGINLNMMGEPENNNIIQNTIFNNKDGIYSKFGRENNISENNIFSNSEYGMYIQSSSNNNIISKNKIYDNSVGIRIKGSEFNNVFNNEFNNNSKKGLYICCGAENNIIYNNSFINNLKHIDYTITNVNLFHKDGVGNYWDDYLERYPNALQLNGVWDTPYKIPGRSFEDKYPLVEPVDI